MHSPLDRPPHLVAKGNLTPELLEEIKALRQPEEKPIEIIEVANGVKDGLYYKLHGNQVSESGTFENDKEEGIWRSYHDNGTVYRETPMVDGMMHGTLTARNKEGRLELEEVWENDGQTS